VHILGAVFLFAFVATGLVALARPAVAAGFGDDGS
jgi:hypothetical protein